MTKLYKQNGANFIPTTWTLEEAELTAQKGAEYFMEVTKLREENKELKKDLQTAIEANKKWLQRDTKLEEQIEKMKNCENCKHISECEDLYCELKETYGECENYSEWELAE